MLPRKIIIRGAGDLATGVAHRLWRSGFSVVMLELAQPLVVRRNVSFASAVYEGSVTVESVTAKLCKISEQINLYLEDKVIPVLVDPDGTILSKEKPAVLIDAIMAKNNTLTDINQAELVIGIGPGFNAGKDADVIVETKRGHNLGRVIYSGRAADDTGEPGLIAGYSTERLLRSPHSGIFRPKKQIGDLVNAGDVIALVDSTEVKTSISGLVRGMLQANLKIAGGVKLGDIDPRGKQVNHHLISDKARAVGGGVLEAILHRYLFKD